MFDPSLTKEIKIIGKSDRQTISLVEHADGKIYLKRTINSDKREIYKTLQKAKNPSIPQIYYIGFDGATTVYEQYIDGISLTNFIDCGNIFTKKQILFIAKQILSALRELHELQIIHRDIKPDNILIDKSNHVWLIDYDIARIYRNAVRKDTEINGTFGYAPIEQYGMLPTDFKTDIYSFGATLKTLLDHSKTKGYLCKIAEKCKRLDPSQRYSSVDEVIKSISVQSIKYPLATVSVLVILAIAVILFMPTKSRTPQTTHHNITNTAENNSATESSKQKPAEAQSAESVTSPSDSNYSNRQPDVKLPSEPANMATSDFDGDFYGFDFGVSEAKYREYSTFSNACIFTTDVPWEHLFFIDDMNKKGQIKLGTNNTVIDADITLNNGELTVNLNDDNGHSFSRQFKYIDSYEYTQSYTKSLRKNADFICYDYDGDGGKELLIGLNEGTMIGDDAEFLNFFNYCIGWCVKYDENNGFKLCDGEMFSKDYSFWINSKINKVNVPWEDFSDVTGYVLEDNQIKGIY